MQQISTVTTINQLKPHNEAERGEVGSLAWHATTVSQAEPSRSYPVHR